MASVGAKLFSFLFLAFLFSQQAQARESQFFSKVTNVNNNVKENELPKQESTVKETELPKQEQEPTFIPETQRGYGLYGHESGQLSPTTTTTTNGGAPYTTTSTTPNNNLPYTTEAEKEQQHTDNYPNRYNTQYNPNKNNYYYNGNNFETNPSGMRDTRLTQSSFTTTNPTNYQNSNYYNNGASNRYNSEKQGTSDTRLTQSSYSTTPTNYQNSNYYNVERQGMSDTRFLENGKYYFDPRSENNYNQNQYGNSRVVDSRNWYNNRGNHGNSNVNQNSYDSMEGYQNEEEFHESEDEFVP